MVGEVRDLETAKIALQSALTGHLVLTTIHTNDAAGTIVRFQALGEKSSNIAPALNLVIGQRLVRRVCLDCLKLEKISAENLIKIKNSLKNLPAKFKIPEIKPQNLISKAQGCPMCNFTGYRGRLGIFEAFLVDPELEKFILTNPSISTLREKVVKKGMVSMQQDGILKVLEGVTTLDEVERATGPI